MHETEAKLSADEAHIRAEAANPLPELTVPNFRGELFSRKSQWHTYGGDELEPHLACTEVIDAAWLLQLAKGEVMSERKGVVPAWQQLPPEAKLTLSQLRQTTMNVLPVAVLSYGWASRSHPDPTGHLLRRLIPVLETMTHCCQHGVNQFFSDDRSVVWGIIWDFMSLPQRGYTTGYDATSDDRTLYEQARFTKGLKSINVWYGHPHVTTLICDWPMPEGAENSAPIEKRGWCIFERRLSGIRSSSDCCLLLGKLVPTGRVRCWTNLLQSCAVGRDAPLAPDAFESMLREGMAQEMATPGTGYRFTNGKDATSICIPQYHHAFLRLMKREGDMSYGNCGIGDVGVQMLASSLAFAHAAGSTSQANRLHLRGSKMTAAALPALMKVITEGALPELIELNLVDNDLGDTGATILIDSIVGVHAGAPSFAKLSLESTGMSKRMEEEVQRACGMLKVTVYF